MAQMVAGEGRSETGDGGLAHWGERWSAMLWGRSLSQRQRGPREDSTHRKGQQLCHVERLLWRKALERAGGGREASMEAAIKNTLIAFKSSPYPFYR